MSPRLWIWEVCGKKERPGSWTLSGCCWRPGDPLSEAGLWDGSPLAQQALLPISAGPVEGDSLSWPLLFSQKPVGERHLSPLPYLISWPHILNGLRLSFVIHFQALTLLSLHISTLWFYSRPSVCFLPSPLKLEQREYASPPSDRTLVAKCPENSQVPLDQRTTSQVYGHRAVKRACLEVSLSTQPIPRKIGEWLALAPAGKWQVRCHILAEAKPKWESGDQNTLRQRQ